MVLTAQSWGWSPTAIIRQAKNPKKHHPADYNFALAVDTLESEKCGHCGVPSWHAFSDDNTIAFKRKEIKCEACAEEARQSKDEKLDPGVRMVIHAVPEEGCETLPGRSDFYRRMEAKALKAAEHAAKQTTGTEG
jgi:hypothetical protein